MANFLAADAIFLSREGQRGKSGGLQVGEWTCERVEGAGPDPKGEVTQPEQGVQLIVGTANVFARAQQKEDTNGEGIGFGLGEGAIGAMCHCHDLTKEDDGEGLDSGGCRVSLGPSAVEGC